MEQGAHSKIIQLAKKSYDSYRFVTYSITVPYLY